MSGYTGSYYESNSDQSFAALDRKQLLGHFVHFMDASEHYGFINLEPSIIGKLRITSEDAFVEEIVPEGILLRRLRKFEGSI
jgi:hypothetical protein